MSGRRRWYIICDQCGEISDHCEQTLRGARKMARYISKAGYDFCSRECAEAGPAPWAMRDPEDLLHGL